MRADGLSAVVLAGTHHWSGSSFERLAPRPLVPVALEPLISYSLRWLRDGRRILFLGNETGRGGRFSATRSTSSSSMLPAA